QSSCKPGRFLITWRSSTGTLPGRARYSLPSFSPLDQSLNLPRRSQVVRAPADSPDPSRPRFRFTEGAEAGTLRLHWHSHLTQTTSSSPLTRHLPVSALPALGDFPKKGEFNDRAAGQLSRWKVGEP